MEEEVPELLVSLPLVVVEASVVVEVDPDSVGEADPLVGVAESEVDSVPLLDDPVGDPDPVGDSVPVGDPVPVGDSVPVADPVPVGDSVPVGTPVSLVPVKYGRVTEPVSVEPEPVSVGVAPTSVDSNCLSWSLAAWATEEPKRATTTVDDLICIVEV